MMMSLITKINNLRKNIKAEYVFIYFLGYLSGLVVMQLPPGDTSKDELCNIQASSKNYIINFSDIKLISTNSISFNENNKLVSITGDYDLDCIKK